MPPGGERSREPVRLKNARARSRAVRACPGKEGRAISVIEVRSVAKTYRRRNKPPLRALDALDLTVDSGGVHGFLGPNGSGKTTTIRALLGLVRVDGGEMRLLGRPVPEALPEVIGDVGALVETPLFFPAFSGRLNLQLLADTAGIPRARVQECLEIVELADRADERFKGYSLGMKQRLGIAAALLKRPRLLILDEPSNGLDPAGIRDTRELIRRLGADGHTTVFLSSHLLAEVEQVCDHVSIMSAGKCVASGRVSDVLAARSTGEVQVRVPNIPAARRVLEDAGHRVTELRPDGAMRVAATGAPEDLTRLLAEHGHYLSELSPIAPDLEAAFLQLTGGLDLTAPGSVPGEKA
jgi:ABC-2 type transport system ATP-binding protein